MSVPPGPMDHPCVNTICTLRIRPVEHPDSGCPGTPLDGTVMRLVREDQVEAGWRGGAGGSRRRGAVLEDEPWR